MRCLFGFAATGLIVFAISQIPYDILREERFRLFGETRTTGVVLEVRWDTLENTEKRFLIQYKYVDNDGFAHQAVAPLQHAVWERYRPGSRIEVVYAQSRPALVRVRGEIEPRFQTWLRSILH
ncbi:MAG: hypothetical protein OCC46_03335 [Pseudodesulfovibrio sp.]